MRSNLTMYTQVLEELANQMMFMRVPNKELAVDVEELVNLTTFTRELEEDHLTTFTRGLREEEEAVHPTMFMQELEEALVQWLHPHLLRTNHPCKYRHLSWNLREDWPRTQLYPLEVS